MSMICVKGKGECVGCMECESYIRECDNCSDKAEYFIGYKYYCRECAEKHFKKEITEDFIDEHADEFEEFTTEYLKEYLIEE